MNWRIVTIGGRIASRFGDTAWPARSPYISERDYIFLGPLESQSIGQQALQPREMTEHTRGEIIASEKRQLRTSMFTFWSGLQEFTA